MSGESKRPLRIEDAALDDATEYELYYETKNPALAERFFEELDEAFEKVERNPEGYSFLFGNARRCPLRRFPILVLYQIREESVRVFAIAHKSQNPRLWKSRFETSRDSEKG